MHIGISAESGTTPAFLNFARAEHHPHSSIERTRPARTGLYAMYSMDLCAAFPLQRFRSIPAPACQILNAYNPYRAKSQMPTPNNNEKTILTGLLTRQRRADGSPPLAASMIHVLCDTPPLAAG